MDKQDLLKQIAETAYNIGFGAKKHFATFDIVDKAPGWIGFISLTIGILGLFIEVLSKKEMSSILIIMGMIGLYVSFYNETKPQYSDKGTELTKLFNELKTLYFAVKSATSPNLDDEQKKLSDIESRYYANCLIKQIFLSDWYAHYKFFWQHQIDWVNEQKHFRFWRDKLPLSFVFWMSIVILSSIGIGIFLLLKGRVF